MSMRYSYKHNDYILKKCNLCSTMNSKGHILNYWRMIQMKNLKGLSAGFLAVSVFSQLLAEPVWAENISDSVNNEIISLRSQYEKHFENGDGTISAFVDSVPVHYLDNGNWVDIDNTLIPDSDGNYTNKSNSFNVTFTSNGKADLIDEIDDTSLVSIDYDSYRLTWDFVSSDISFINEDVPVCINDYEYQREIDMGNDDIEKELEQSLKNTISSASYKSLFDGIDVEIELRANTVKENIVLNSSEAAQIPIVYYITAEGIIPKVNENNSVSFINDDGETIYNIPAPYMFDSSEKDENNYNIGINIENYENGYLLHYIPDRTWLESDERVYPVTIDPVVDIQNGITTTTINQGAPNSSITGDSLKIGGVPGNRFEAVVSLPGQAVNYNDRITITDARLYMFFSENNGIGADSQIGVYSINGSYTPNWTSVHNQNTTKVEQRTVNVPGLSFFDVTTIINAWRNYVRSGGKAGIYSYGLYLQTETLNSRIYTANSNSGMHPPYYRLTYTIDTDYTFTYSPTKYDDFESVKNFQYKMNCYAYALQIFENSNVAIVHALLPGVLNRQNDPSYYITYEQMRNQYKSFTNINQFENFTEQQMFWDSNVLGANLNRFSILGNQFSLPSGYNQNTQRVIAMNVAERKSISSGIYEQQRFDFHFFVRHGNGSCSIHGGTCSKWSHKLGNNRITDKINDVLLCDQNIVSRATNFSIDSGNVRITYQNLLRFYTIEKTTNIYNSWYNYNAGLPTV